MLELTRADDHAAEQGALIDVTSNQAAAVTEPATGAEGGSGAATASGTIEARAEKQTARAKAQKAKRKAQAKARRQPPLPEVDGVVAIDAVGDIVMGSPTRGVVPGGGRAFFASVESMFTGDVVLGNLEGTLATGGTSHCAPDAENCFSFRSSPGEARWLRRSGFTTLNLANNHAFDFGSGALRETRRALTDRRLDHVGAPGQITVRRIGKIRVAVVGFSTYAWGADMRDVNAAKALVRKATQRGHVVVVTMHSGAEGAQYQHVKAGDEYFLGQNRGDSVRFARSVIDAGADLVVGHGPHVLRGMEWYKGRLIAYSLGNFAGYNVFNLDGPRAYSGVLKVRLNADGTWVSGELAATKLVGRGVPVRDRSERAHALVRKLSSADFGRRAVRVSPRGELLRPRS